MQEIYLVVVVVMFVYFNFNWNKMSAMNCSDI